MKTKIYGASDDLVEIEGIISDEHDCYDHKKPIRITASDGTIGSIFYGGEWKISVKFAGDKYIEKIDSVGDDGKHIGIAAGCTSYSDVLVFDDGIEWVKIGRKLYKQLYKQ
jgi:hypothetical protein